MRMKWFFPVLLLAAGGCTDLLSDEVIDGNGHVVGEVRSTGRFTGVSNATMARVDILQGPTERVRVLAEENLQPYIRTRVENNTLRIYVDGSVTLRPRAEIVVEVDIVTLNRLFSSGSGEVNAPVVDAGRLEIVSSGAGDIYVESLLADSIVINSSGAGRVLATGDVRSVRITHSGAGPIDTKALNASVVDAVVSGSGTSTVRARDWIYAVLSGAGSLRYYGSPTVQHTTTGAGRVTRVGS